MKPNKPIIQEESFKIYPVQPKMHQEQNKGSFKHKLVGIGVISTRERFNKERISADLNISKPLVSNSIMDAKSSTEMDPDFKRKSIDLVICDEKKGVPLKFKIKFHQKLSKFLFLLL